MISNNRMTSEIFDFLSRPHEQPRQRRPTAVDDRDQVRSQQVRHLPGNPLVTPYDVFRTYRDQKELVSAKAVEIPVDKFLEKVAEPSAAEIEEVSGIQGRLARSGSRDSRFQGARQIQVEILSIDENALARGIKDKLTEQELRTAYENRKKEFPALPKPGVDLPVDLFAGQPELTPPALRPFEDVRAQLAVKLAEDRAKSLVSDKFTKLKDDVMLPFADQYASALDALEEARKKDPNATATMPEPQSLKEIAQREGLNYEVTKMLSREQADEYGQISSSKAGSDFLSGGRKFAEEFFDSRKALYDPEELVDLLRTR